MNTGSYFLGNTTQFNAWKDVANGKGYEGRQDLIELAEQEIKELFPEGIENAKEPPLNTSPENAKEGDWQCTLKNGNIVTFYPTVLNRKQTEHIVPWMIVNLDVLGDLYPWEIEGDQ